VKNSVIGSAAVHVVLTAVAFLVHTGSTVLVPGPDVVQVSLVDASLAPVQAPAQTAAKPAPEPVEPTEEKGVRLEKPKPKKPEQPAPQHEEPTPQTAAPAPTTPGRVVLPYADVGGGMRGQVAVDEKNFEFAYYLQQVRVMIARNWTPPPGVPGGMRAEVYFRVARDGSLSAPRIETASGNEFFDQSATRAVMITGHLPPLPLGYSGSDLGVHFGFEYAGP